MGGSYAGVDWASEKHEVLIADAAGEELVAATFCHDESGLRSLCRTLVGHNVELVALTGCWSSGCWTQDCGCWRCIPTRSRRHVRGFGLRAGSLTALMRS